MFCLLFHSSQWDSSHQFPEVVAPLKKPPQKIFLKKKRTSFFFLTALLKVPLPIPSLCYLTDSSFFPAQKVQLSLPSWRLPSSCSLLQRPAAAPPRQHRPCAPSTSRPHRLNVNRRRTKNGCQSQLSVCLSPSLPKSFPSPPCRLLLMPKAYRPFYSPVRFELLRGNCFFLRGLASALALRTLKLICCLRKNQTTQRKDRCKSRSKIVSSS